MLHVALLRLADVAEQRAGGADRALAAGEVQLLQGGDAEVVQQLPLGRGVFKARVLDLVHALDPRRDEVRHPAARRRAGGEHRLVGREAGQLVERVVLGEVREVRGAEFARGDVAEGRAAAPPVQPEGAEIVGPLVVEHALVRDRAGGDDADDVALHETLGQRRVLQLVADGDLVAVVYELFYIAVGGVIGHAAHGGLLLRGLVPVARGEH